MKVSKLVSAAIFSCAVLSQSTASGQLTADYTFDESGFFTSIPAARLAAEAAIADLNAVLNQNLGAITNSDLIISSTHQTATVDISVSASIRNPSTGSMVDVSPVNAPSVVRLYLGAMPQSFNSVNSVLGTGGPGSYGISAGVSFGNASDIGIAAETAGMMATAVHSRGEGPVIASFDSAFVINNSNGTQTSYPYQVNFGLGHGSISFDNDTNNNNVDDLTEGIDPADFFHFDHTVAPAANKSDFYSTALHEALHAIGMGASNAWDSLVDGSNWTGSEVINYLGNGTGLIDASGGHVTPGILSPRITDGVLQESVLVPSSMMGERAVLTELDLAFLRDLGFAGAVVPPRVILGDFDLDGDVDLADLDRYIGNLDSLAVGELQALDLDRNGRVEAADFETHYSTLVETSNGGKGTAAGDVNLDGVVDVLGDAFQLVSNLGNPATSWSQGDVNGDGRVDVLGDAFDLVRNLGADNGGLASFASTADMDAFAAAIASDSRRSRTAASTTAVPEPTSWPLLILLSGLFGYKRRRANGSMF